MAIKGLVLLDAGPGREALKRHCRQNKIPVTAFESLVEAELDQVGKVRKKGLWERFDEIFTEIADARDSE